MKATTLDYVKVFLLGMIAAFLGVLAFQDNSPGIAFAEGGGSANGLIAVTGPEKASLFLVDTGTQHIAHYNNNTGGRMKLRDGRLYKYDLGIEDDGRSAGYTVKEAEKMAKESMEGR